MPVEGRGCDTNKLYCLSAASAAAGWYMRCFDAIVQCRLYEWSRLYTGLPGSMIQRAPVRVALLTINPETRSAFVNSFSGPQGKKVILAVFRRNRDKKEISFCFGAAPAVLPYIL